MFSPTHNPQKGVELFPSRLNIKPRVRITGVDPRTQLGQLAVASVAPIAQRFYYAAEHQFSLSPTDYAVHRTRLPGGGGMRVVFSHGQVYIHLDVPPVTPTEVLAEFARAQPRERPPFGFLFIPIDDSNPFPGGWADGGLGEVNGPHQHVLLTPRWEEAPLQSPVEYTLHRGVPQSEGWPDEPYAYPYGSAGSWGNPWTKTAVSWNGNISQGLFIKGVRVDLSAVGLSDTRIYAAFVYEGRLVVHAGSELRVYGRSGDYLYTLATGLPQGQPWRNAFIAPNGKRYILLHAQERHIFTLAIDEDEGVVVADLLLEPQQGTVRVPVTHTPIEDPREYEWSLSVVASLSYWRDIRWNTEAPETAHEFEPLTVFCTYELQRSEVTTSDPIPGPGSEDGEQVVLHLNRVWLSSVSATTTVSLGGETLSSVTYSESGEHLRDVDQTYVWSASGDSGSWNLRLFSTTEGAGTWGPVSFSIERSVSGSTLGFTQDATSGVLELASLAINTIYEGDFPDNYNSHYTLRETNREYTVSGSSELTIKGVPRHSSAFSAATLMPPDPDNEDLDETYPTRHGTVRARYAAAEGMNLGQLTMFPAVVFVEAGGVTTSSEPEEALIGFFSGATQHIAGGVGNAFSPDGPHAGQQYRLLGDMHMGRLRYMTGVVHDPPVMPSAATGLELHLTGADPFALVESPNWDAAANPSWTHLSLV